MKNGISVKHCGYGDMTDVVDILRTEISELRRQLMRSVLPATEGIILERKIASLKYAIKVIEDKHL